MQRLAKRLSAIGVFLFTGLASHAQITTSNAFTPQQIVQNVLLGPGVTASNFVFNGDANQLGTFSCTNCNVGMSAGLLMCSGDISEAVGPNNSSSLTLGGGNFGVNDPDLDMLIAPAPTNDRAALEFDFVATGDSIKFNFIFASEEYLEWVGSQFQDAFGFFLSGPGIVGPYSNNSVNLAVVPGTPNTPITINTINDVTNSAYYIDNGDGFTAPMNTDPFYIQFDGFTTILVARAAVICGQTYHIKLTIADGSDTAYDCGVFIEAGSFQSNLVDLSSDIISGAVDSVLLEGCGETDIVFVRGGDLSDSLLVSLSESGTATNGVDHTLIPGSVLFLPGQDSIVINVQVILDALVEGVETATITASYSSPCSTSSTDIVFYLADAPPINIVLSNDTTLTCSDSSLVVANVSGGYGTLYLDWNTGIPDGDSIGWVQPLQTTTYTLTVTDDCGVVTQAESMTITVPQPPPLIVQALPDTTVFCPESPVALSCLVSGGTPGYTYSWSNGLGSATTANVSPATTQTYALTVTDHCGHDTTDQVTVTVQYDTVQVVITPDTVMCNGDTITLHALPSLGYNGYSLLWDDGSTQTDRAVWPSVNTIYDVTVTDGCGISASDQAGVGVNSPLAAFSYTGSVYVENFPVQFLDQSFGATSWSWDFNYPGITSAESSPVITYPTDGDFTVMLAIMDQLGCVDTTYRNIHINPEFQFYAPNAFTPDGIAPNDVFFGSGVGMDEYQMRIYDRWGEMIFETHEMYGAWDGKVNGQDAPVGVYVYWFHLHSISGKKAEYTGHVTLVR